MADAKMLGKERLIARFARLPKAMKDAVAPVLQKEVSELVAAQRRAAPVSSDLEDTPGQFRDSINYYPNRDRPLSFRVIADARDEKGAFIGPHIEHGHKAKDGSHVAAVPSFFPTYRARKKAMQRRLNAAGRKAAKAMFPE